MIIRSNDGLREAKNSMDLTGGAQIARASTTTASRRKCLIVAISNQHMTSGEEIPMAPLHMATGTLDGAIGISANQGNPHGHGKLPRS